MSSSERSESSRNWFGELNGDWCHRVVVSIGRCVRFLFLTVCQGWVVGVSGSITGFSSNWWALCVYCLWCWVGDERVMDGARGHVDDCKCITLQLTCGSESEVAELENECGALWCCDDGSCCDICWCWFPGIADHWIVGVCWDDSSLKDQSDDMDFNYCCGRGYAAHCLHTKERARNTSAQHERHSETSQILEFKKFC